MHRPQRLAAGDEDGDCSASGSTAGGPACRAADTRHRPSAALLGRRCIPIARVGMPGLYAGQPVDCRGVRGMREPSAVAAVFGG